MLTEPGAFTQQANFQKRNKNAALVPEQLNLGILLKESVI